MSLVEAIDLQIEYLLETRAVFPYMSKAPIGKTRLRTPPFYRTRGFDVHVEFSEPLTNDDVHRIRSIGHWINQNFIVRLCALLEANDVIPTDGKGRIDHGVEGGDEVDILRRLRNQFAHSSGRYDPSDPEQRRLYERVVAHFDAKPVEEAGNATGYPLPIDVVLLPMAEGCKKYIVERDGA